MKLQRKIDVHLLLPTVKKTVFKVFKEVNSNDTKIV